MPTESKNFSFSSHRNLSLQEIIAIVESTSSYYFAERYQRPTNTFQHDDLSLHLSTFSTKNGILSQKVLKVSNKIAADDDLKALVEDHIAMASILKQVHSLKTLERHLLWGEIFRSTPDGSFIIEAELRPDEPIIAVCPLNHVGLHERQSSHLKKGQRRAFHPHRVEPVRLNGLPRIKMVVDRVSKTLTENLLLFHLGDQTDQLKIRCVKRFVGHKSVVLANKRLPKKVIVAVDKELRERVEVHIQINLR